MLVRTAIVGLQRAQGQLLSGVVGTATAALPDPEVRLPGSSAAAAENSGLLRWDGATGEQREDRRD